MNGLRTIASVFKSFGKTALLWTAALAEKIRARLGLRRQERPEAQQLLAVLAGLDEARDELKLAEMYFNTVTETALLDYTCYRMLAARCKYAHFLAEARTVAVPADLDHLLLAVAIRKSTLL